MDQIENSRMNEMNRRVCLGEQVDSWSELAWNGQILTINHEGQKILREVSISKGQHM